MLGRGTIQVMFGVAPGDADAARSALEAAGFTVAQEGETGVEVEISASDVYATDSPDAEAQREHQARAAGVLDAHGLAYRDAGSAVVIGGGTPAHRWVELLLGETGRPVGRVLAMDEAEAQAQRDEVAAELGLPPAAIEVRWQS